MGYHVLRLRKEKKKVRAAPVVPVCKHSKGKKEKKKNVVIVMTVVTTLVVGKNGSSLDASREKLHASFIYIERVR